MPVAKKTTSPDLNRAAVPLQSVASIVDLKSPVNQINGDKDTLLDSHVESIHHGSEPEPLQPQPNAGKAINWQATKSDWDMLGSTRNRRGWQMVALSFGYRPISGISEKLPKLEAEQYARRLRVLRNSATVKRSKTKLQYESSVHSQGSKLNPDDPASFAFDIVKFVDFFTRLPAGEKIHPLMVEIADQHRMLTADAEPVKVVPSRNVNAAVSRVDGSLWDIALGLAMKHYNYVPVGISGMATSQDKVKGTTEAIAEGLSETGLTVTAKVIESRLREATVRLGKRENDREKVAKALSNKR